MRSSAIHTIHDIGPERQIHTFDNLFDQQFMSDTFLYATMSTFKIGWGDTVAFEDQTNKYLHAQYSMSDIHALKILDVLQDTPIAPMVEGMYMTKAVLNLSTPSDAHFTHVHPEAKVILYYPNIKWADGWHGETLFFDQDAKNIVLATRYTPGRVTVFDGSTPHSIRPQSTLAPQFRFTLALVYDWMNKDKK